jgi:hypothetical protein
LVLESEDDTEREKMEERKWKRESNRSKLSQIDSPLFFALLSFAPAALLLSLVSLFSLSL